MFNVGGAEFLVILVLALLVLGPDKLPEAARQFGKFSAQFRDMARGFQKELDAVKTEFVELSDLSEAQARANGAAAVRDSKSPFDNKMAPRGNLHKFDTPNPDSPAADSAEEPDGGDAPGDEKPRPTFDAATANPDRTEKPVIRPGDPAQPSVSSAATEPPPTDTELAEAEPVNNETSPAAEPDHARPNLDGTEML